ncbi:transglycosylase domain-containing protein [Myxococcota bacterium]|nr:transglycosylase domain-containing protein [Myxococcota bacterium]
MAVVAAEDAAFFGHSGFDAEGIQAAVLENLQEGGEGRGGSTITQQLAKNLFLSGDRTVIRKLREAVLAARMEEVLSKQRILELYLAVAEWGHEVYGIRDAARHYFGKEPAELRAREAAYLALMLPSPRRYHDYYHAVGKVTEHLQASVDGMVRRMHRLGFIDQEAYVREMTWGLAFAGCDRSGQAPFDEPRPKGPPPEDLAPDGVEGDEPLTFWDLEPMEEPGMPPAQREGPPAPP